MRVFAFQSARCEVSARFTLGSNEASHLWRSWEWRWRTRTFRLGGNVLTTHGRRGGTYLIGRPSSQNGMQSAHLKDVTRDPARWQGEKGDCIERLVATMGCSPLCLSRSTLVSSLLSSSETAVFSRSTAATAAAAAGESVEATSANVQTDEDFERVASAMPSLWSLRFGNGSYGERSNYRSRCSIEMWVSVALIV